MALFTALNSCDMNVSSGSVQCLEMQTEVNSDENANEAITNENGPPSIENRTDDVIYQTICRSTAGTPAYLVVGVSICMAVVSVILPIQYSLAIINGPDLNGGTSSPLWVSLLELQTTMIQNLFHASLLGGAGLVAAFRGDYVWLLFARNCAFFFGLSALSYFVIDVTTLFRNDIPVDGRTVRLAITAPFSACTVMAFFKLSKICRRVRCMVLDYVCSGAEQIESNRDKYPATLAQTESQLSNARIIFYGAKAVEILAVVYTVIITSLYVMKEEDKELNIRELLSFRALEGEAHKQAQLLPLEMAYGLGAHQAFLLSLFLLASTYASCRASVGGAILGSAWRLTAATCSIYRTASTGTSFRRDLSLAFTTVEACLMVPILVAAIRLKREENGDGTRPQQKYSRLQSDDAWIETESVELETDAGCVKDTEEISPTQNIGLDACTFQCPSLWQISASPLFTKRKRRGAFLLWVSSLVLLVEMTLECAALLEDSILEWNKTHDIFKWGMHVSAMYAFVCVMSVSSPDVYRRSRILLSFACPAGSLIAVWQIFMMVAFDNNWQESTMSLVILNLFIVRALSGLGQCLGLLYLSDTNFDSSAHKDLAQPSSGDIETRCEAAARARKTLWFLYMPAITSYVVGSTLMGNGELPLIPPTMSPHGESWDIFLLAQNWPGMVIFFHFGILLVIFAEDGIGTNVPSYRPSLFIATMFSGHLTFLLAADSLWGIQAQDDLEPNDVNRKVLVVILKLASLRLSFCLWRLWKHRILPLESTM